MADSYILNIKPTISASDGRKMEADLNNRFSRVAKKFGGALRTAGSKFKGIVAGGIATAFAALYANPIEKINNALNNTLKKADTIATRAAQIGTTSGKLIQVQAVAESAGVTNFNQVISKFQTELEKSRKGEQPILSQFAKEKDTLTAFIQVIDAIKSLKPSEQSYFVTKIFGEDAVIQLAEFLQADLLQRRNQIFGGTTEEQLTKAINKVGAAEDLQAVLSQQTSVADLLEKSQSITNETVRLQNEYNRAQLRTENAQFSQYDNFVRMAAATEEGKAILSDMQASIVPLLEKSVNTLDKIWDWLKNSRLGKLVGGVFK